MHALLPLSDTPLELSSFLFEGVSVEGECREDNLWRRGDHESGGFPAGPKALDFFARFPLLDKEIVEKNFT